MKGNQMRSIKLTWKQLEDILKKQGLVLTDENVSEVTLVRPRSLLLHLRFLDRKIE